MDHDFRDNNSIEGKRLNTLGYRCDEFSEPSEILFGGCSNTFGYSLDPEYSWPSLVHQNKFKQSPFHSLGMNGASTIEIIFNVFNYFKNVGNPKIVCLLLPELYRGYDEGDLAEKRSHQFYSMLDIYCKSNNIKLIAMSWDYKVNGRYSTNDFFVDKFESFYNIDLTAFDEMVYNYHKENKNEEDVLVAKDRVHLGKAQHYVLSKLFLNNI